MSEWKMKAEIEIPRVPNFVRITGGWKLPVSHLSDEDLRKLAKEWGEALIANAQRQRKLDTNARDKELATAE